MAKKARCPNIRAANHVCVCMVCMVHRAVEVLCVRSQDPLPSVSVRRVHVVFSTTGCENGGKPCPKIRDTVAEERLPGSLTHLAGIEPEPLVRHLTALIIMLTERRAAKCTTK